MQHDSQEAVDKGHGRLEIRRRWVITDPEVLAWIQAAHRWPGIAGIGRAQTERRLRDRTTVGTRLYVLSRPLSTQAVGEALRSHRGIEHHVHWVLDVSFGEGQSRIRQGAAAENAAILRRIALNVIGQHPWKRASLKARRLIASWNDTYRRQLLQAL